VRQNEKQRKDLPFPACFPDPPIIIITTNKQQPKQKKKKKREIKTFHYLLRSPAAALLSDPDAASFAPDIAACARLRPMTTLPSPSPSETSAGSAAAAVFVVVVFLEGITKYRPIALRTAAFAAPPMPAPPGCVLVLVAIVIGSETDRWWPGTGEHFLYYTCPTRLGSALKEQGRGAGRGEQDERGEEGELERESGAIFIFG
jgi:hypothetical protein